MVCSLGNPPVSDRLLVQMGTFADQGEQTTVQFAANPLKFSGFCAYIYMYVDTGIYVCISKLPFQTETRWPGDFP
jgi:hypothetical protein